MAMTRQMQGTAAARAVRWALGWAMTLALAGCGGGGGGADAAPPADTVPPTALVSAPAYVAFVQTLQPDDAVEPLKLNGAVAPVSETDEPVEVD